MKPRALAITFLAVCIVGAPLAAQRASHGGAQPAPSSGRDVAPPPVLFPPQESAGTVTLLMAPRWAEGRLTVLLRPHAAAPRSRCARTSLTASAGSASRWGRAHGQARGS
jgi:hypothetical protein